MKIVSGDIKAVAPFEYILGTNNEAFKLGEILALSSGRLTKAGVDSSGEQTFICMREQPAETTAVTPIPVVRLRPDIELQTKSSATIAKSLIGTKVTLDSNATGVTATATDGVFVIRSTDGDKLVTGHFE